MDSQPQQTILIADDEPLARQRIRRLLEDLPVYRAAREAKDEHDPPHKIADPKPDILLLDIRMPGMDGMQAAGQISQLDNPPAVIFCTAYDHFAIQAFDVQACGYLLRPVRKEALAQTLARAGRTNRVQRRSLAGQTGQGAGQLAVRTHRGTELIDLDTILYCEADQKYVTLHHTRGETLCVYTLKELEQAYPQQLLRIHRNTLVGVRFIRGLQRSSDGHHSLALKGLPAGLPVSRRHAGHVRQWLQEHQPSP